MIGRIKEIRPLRRFVRITLYKETESSSDWREHIRDFPDGVVSRYETEICELERMLGKDLAAWRAPPLNSRDPALVASPSSGPDDSRHAGVSARSNDGPEQSPAETFNVALTTPDKN